MSLAMTPNIEEGDAFVTDKMSFDSSEMLRENFTSEEDVERLRQLVEEMTAKYDAASKRSVLTSRYNVLWVCDGLMLAC